MDIFIDLDGTIIKSEEGVLNATEVALKKRNIEYKREDLLEFIGPPLSVSFLDYVEEAEVESAIKDFREYYEDGGMFECELYERIDLLIKKWSKDHRIFLATSKGHDFAIEIIKYFGLYEYFDGFYCASMDGKIVHKIDVLKEAVKNEKLNNPIMIGDRGSDMKAANELDFKTIGVLYGYGSKEELEENNAQMIAQRVEDLELLI